MPVWAQGLYTFLIAFTVPFYCLIGFGWISPGGVFAMFQLVAVLMLPLVYWNRAKYSSRKDLYRMTAMLLLTPTMLAGFAAAFYYMMEVRGEKGILGQSIAGGVGTLWILGWVAFILKVFPGGGSITGSGYEPYDWEEFNRQFRAAQAKLLADLEADPRLRKYIPAVQNSEIFSMDEVLYQEDPTLTVTCPHLRAIEAAMRASGIHVRRTYSRMGEAAASYVFANAIIDEKALRARYRIPWGVTYSEYYNEWEERGPGSDARLHCEGCHSSIQVHHPNERQPSTKDFPV
ncbi:MAG: hypothetical protein JNK87_21600 [Bryobacterales bacterium]|nr:hypothetical protein [Bryobacterales bacterium]